MSLSATEKAQLREGIQKLAGTFDRDFVSIFLANVDDVSASDRTIKVTPISGGSSAQISNVLISPEANDGVLMIPAIDSTVLIGTSVKNKYYVLMFSDVDKVICNIDANNYYEFSSSGFIWNGGAFGGIGKTGVIASKLNVQEAAENALKIIISAILSAGASSPGTPVTNGTLAAFFAGYNVVPITPTTQVEISDDKIKH